MPLLDNVEPDATESRNVPGVPSEVSVIVNSPNVALVSSARKSVRP